MALITGGLIAGLLSTALCIEWSSFQQWSGFSTSFNNALPLYIDSREQIVTCCGVCASIPECTTVVLNNDHCICSSEFIPHSSQVDENTSVFVKRQKSCSAPGYIFMNNVCIKVSTDEKTWHEAKLDCENTGGNLIILDSLEKHQRVLDLLIQYFENTAIQYFVGASDIEKEGSWSWIMENSSSYMHNAVLNNVDSGFKRQGADCGTFDPSDNEIIDEFCDQLKQYICEVMLK